MISRRLLLATAPLAAAAYPAQALPVPQGNRIAFQMLRKGDVIGRHELTFMGDGAALTVNVAIDIQVKFGGITVYRYMHRATERWRGEQFIGIESRTDRDGTPQFMTARREGGDLLVEGSKTQRYMAPPGTFATTYWNMAMLQSHVINSEDGRLFHVTPQQLAEEEVPLAAGRRLRARHWKLDGDLPLDLWYDTAGQWAHLVFTKDGSTVVYQKL